MKIHITEQMPSLLINDEKIKDPEKVADVFNSFFLSIAENLNLDLVWKEDPIYFLKAAFPCEFHGIKIVPTSEAEIKSIMYVCMYVCTVISPKAGWLLIQRWHQMRTPTHPCTRIYLHMHMQAHTHKYTYSTPHTTNTRRTKPRVEWGRVASSFPPPYCAQPGNDEVHYLAEVGTTNVIYLHHPQTILSLKSKKNSSGYNEVTIKILKACASLITRSLSHIYNHSIYTDVFPDRQIFNSKTIVQER
jgi:hypothetical protein